MQECGGDSVTGGRVPLIYNPTCEGPLSETEEGSGRPPRLCRQEDNPPRGGSQTHPLHEAESERRGTEKPIFISQTEKAGTLPSGPLPALWGLFSSHRRTTFSLGARVDPRQMEAGRSAIGKVLTEM